MAAFFLIFTSTVNLGHLLYAIPTQIRAKNAENCRPDIDHIFCVVTGMLSKTYVWNGKLLYLREFNQITSHEKILHFPEPCNTDAFTSGIHAGAA